MPASSSPVENKSVRSASLPTAGAAGARGPVEVIRVLGRDGSELDRGRRRAAPTSLRLEEGFKARASRLASWLKGGAAPETRCAALGVEPARRQIDLGRGGAELAGDLTGDLAGDLAALDKGAFDEKAFDKKAWDQGPSEINGVEARGEAPVAEPRLQEAPVERTGADRQEGLALRIALLGGEIVEQVYGPARRWALLGSDGAALETPPAEEVRALIAGGRLLFDRFERGAAVWRLSGLSAPAARAAYRQGPAA